jgi:8-oxo-dGTP diphosphatase
VLTDAPEILVEVLAEEYDGWVDHEDVADVPQRSQGLDLPDGPRRIKRPDPE